MAIKVRHIETLGDGTVVYRTAIENEENIPDHYTETALFNGHPVLCEAVTPWSDTVKLPRVTQFDELVRT